MEPSRHGPFSYTPINRRPAVRWPGGAHLALWVVPNLETFPLDEPVPGGTGRTPDVINWARRDYGARVGVFRLMDTLAAHGIRATAALNSEVCDDHPEVVEDAMALGWEFMGHNQSNSRHLDALGDADGRRLVADALARIAEATGVRPRGWLSSGLQENWTTLDALVDNGCTYVADWVNDDQPYVMRPGNGAICSIPYSAETNDLPQIWRAGRTADEFADILCRQFDTLYRESVDSGSGRVMAVCLHPFVIGVPHRIPALGRALAHICGHDGVWRATGSEIVDHYLAGDTF